MTCWMDIFVLFLLTKNESHNNNDDNNMMGASSSIFFFYSLMRSSSHYWKKNAVNAAMFFYSCTWGKGAVHSSRKVCDSIRSSQKVRKNFFLHDEQSRKVTRRQSHWKISFFCDMVKTEPVGIIALFCFLRRESSPHIIISTNFGRAQLC